MRITIFTIGAESSPSLSAEIANFTKRLPRHLQLQWVYIPNGKGDLKTSRKQEAEQLLQKIPDGCRVILLDERGTLLSSEAFAKQLFQQSSDVVFIIGGSYGVDERIKQRADSILSLSTLVFPHQLVRILLAEQLYRAYTIDIGHPYHHA